MRQALAALLVLFCSVSYGQSSASQSGASQTARQALIEMFFGESANHMEKHLPDVTKKSLKKFSGPGGENYLSQISMMASQIRRSGAKIEILDTGPTLLSAEDQQPGGGPDKIEITVERDDLIGDEDQIELALHLSKDGKEENLPVIPRFVFAMQSEANVWKLNEVTVTVRVPLTDPNFLKTMEDEQRTRSELMTMMMVRQVNSAETNYTKAKGRYACDLSTLGSQYLYDPELIKGSKSGYNFVISNCDPTRYKVVAEPTTADSEQRAFCSDESGELRAASDGKATTCLSRGEVVEKAPVESATGIAVMQASSAPTTGTAGPIASDQRTPGAIGPAPPVGGAVPQRIRVSQGVMKGLLVSEVQPVYPATGTVNIEGSVILSIIVGKDGAVKSAKVVTSSSPLLNTAALDTVKQWKYRPYLLNGTPLEVDTTATVNFKSPKK
jgi:TonB family protein